MGPLWDPSGNSQFAWLQGSWWHVILSSLPSLLWIFTPLLRGCKYQYLAAVDWLGLCLLLDHSGTFSACFCISFFYHIVPRTDSSQGCTIDSVVRCLVTAEGGFPSGVERDFCPEQKWKMGDISCSKPRCGHIAVGFRTGLAGWVSARKLSSHTAQAWQRSEEWPPGAKTADLAGLKSRSLPLCTFACWVSYCTWWMFLVPALVSCPSGWHSAS